VKHHEGTIHLAYNASTRALRIWNFSQPLPGTLAERYLRHRGITIKPPASLRFNANIKHPSGDNDTYYPALIACAEFPDGRFAGINRTWLDPSTQNLKLDREPQKATLGTAAGVVVRLTPTLSDTVVLTEAVEDGLSIVQATAFTVWTTLGTNFSAVHLPDCVKNVIIAGDNDSPGQRAAALAVKHFHAQGRRVQTVYPPLKFKDFNEALKA
jgi:hypothetical protein